MNESDTHTTDDPLGLRDLPLLEPDRDGWPAVRAALEADAAPARRARVAPWLAAATCLLLALTIVVLRPGSAPPDGAAGPAVADASGAAAVMEPAGGAAPVEAGPPADDELHQLIALSQVLEQRLRALRENTAAIPAETTVYVAELEDLVAQVDDRLGQEPDSIDLWGQRVNLLLDLEYLYQHQVDRQYGRMASL